MKIYVIAAMHGDEAFGLKVLDRLEAHASSNLQIKVGHPKALSLGKRFIETDLNRSFNIKPRSIESDLANKIASEIDEFNPNFIIDIHTSVSGVSKVGIVASTNSDVFDVAQTLGMESIVVMPENLSKNSLIGAYPTKSVSVELGISQRSNTLAKTLAEKIVDLSRGAKPLTNTQPVYVVNSTIPKDFVGLDNIKNLEYNQQLDGYPFLAGQDTYEDMGGFLAVRLQDKTA